MNRERSLKDTSRERGGRENRWPTSLDYRDPEGIADFCLGLGYDEDDVVNTLVQRCSLDRVTARRIVQDVARNNQGGPHVNH